MPRAPCAMRRTACRFRCRLTRVIFAYDDWNDEHVQKHGVKRADAEYVIRQASSPYPRKIEEGKYIVYGPDRGGRILEVVFTYRTAEQLGVESVSFEDLVDIAKTGKDPIVVYIIHAMPVPGRRARRYRPRRK